MLHPVEAEETPVQGLVITPKLHYVRGFEVEVTEGEYRVTHVPTGLWVAAPVHFGDLINERDVLHKIVDKLYELGARDWTSITAGNYTKDQVNLWLRAIRETWDELPQQTRDAIEARWHREDEDW